MKPSLVSLLTLALMLPAGLTLAAARGPAPASADPYLWLEDVTGQKSMDWVKQQNAVSTKELTESPDFKALDERFLKIVNSDARIPAVTKYGDRYYNFWRDAQHPRGIWRRTTLDEYRKAAPAWETVIDLDAIGKAEGVNWVWEGARPLPPEERYCLVSLSRGGADATVVREFDLQTGAFVEGGFTLPESKSEVSWVDHDRLYVGFAFDSSTMTQSGYARIVKEWKRGTPLSEAAAVYEGQATDVGVGAYHEFTPGFERDFVYRGINTYANEVFLRRDGKLVKIDKPDDAELNTFREWLLLTLRTDWTTGGKTWPAGALISIRLDDFLAGQRAFQELFHPSERISLAGYSNTLNALILEELDNVRSRLYVVKPEGGTWSRTAIPGLPEFGNLNAGPVDPFTSDDYWLTVTDFLTPTTLSLATVGGGAPEKLKETPAFFDASRDEVSQHEAVSKDGTRIPYFEVGPRDPAARKNAPTLLTGYGGFEVSSLPGYNALQGAGWLERGGILVVANIRGGGEFGPKWHQGGVKEQRHHCYEDFIAVAEDLVQRGVTTPARLGCTGGSNGGLLVGNMLVMRPDLFGAIACHAPLLDMRRYHHLLAGASWMAEYGDPDDPKQWDFIRVWSPYQAAKKGVKYPRILFTSSTRDDRVHPGHARKMVAKLEDQGHDVLYYENIEGGHGGAATNEQRAFMSALSYSFLWKQLGGAPVK
jgi:prolyl oligopeptidase